MYSCLVCDLLTKKNYLMSSSNTTAVTFETLVEQNILCYLLVFFTNKELVHLRAVNKTFKTEAENAIGKIKGRGILIALEGIDKVGKTTQCTLLTNWMNNKLCKDKEFQLVQAQSIAFPDRTTFTGERLNKYLKKELSLTSRAAHLLFVANREEKREFIIQSLMSGRSIILDRYSYSGVAYSKEPLKWSCPLESEFAAPDIVFLFEGDPEILKNRNNYGSEIFENTEEQKRVIEVYSQIFGRGNKTHWVHINAIEDVDLVLQRMQPYVKLALCCRKGEPIHFNPL